ncbi:SAM-dependent methyltransferase [Sphingomonas sp. LY160]|uniref:SAM-dependent methyltransferase n=1 Tax=Sphingomonas sp. LY160 TaxID=3095342 RepID=UPI002ADEC945|nr:SAM-dependent methyltransferase [Sphingomonas sp. LY160]MEA1073267.1 SAM-dependent methyltransferase [Sphingomonas sp. LY160]
MPPRPDLFDRRLRALRRDRAAAIGGDGFPHERAFDECLDRLAAIARHFERALLVGCFGADWPARLGAFADVVEVVEPGPRLAAAVGAIPVEEDRVALEPQAYDLIVAVGSLDTVNDLSRAFAGFAHALRPDSVLIGALAGGNSLPTLRAALIEAERATGRVVSRTHPRIDAPTLAGLLGAAGFAMPVVDVDRVSVRYRDLSSLVRDLRAMGASSQLAERAPPLGRATLAAAAAAFKAMGNDGRTAEQFDLLHFLGWSPSGQARR